MWWHLQGAARCCASGGAGQGGGDRAAAAFWQPSWVTAHESPQSPQGFRPTDEDHL